MSDVAKIPVKDLIACPQCDAVYRYSALKIAHTARCSRCHTVLVSRKRDAGLHIITLSLASFILVIAALFQPFLEIRRLGFWSDASLLDFAFAFSGGLMMPLTFLVIALIIAVPLARLTLTAYSIAPLVFDKRPWRGAKRAFRISEMLRPWSMAEIFVLGCAVSLIKLTDLARVEMGAAFWMFVALVCFMFIQDRILCAWSVWQSLDR